MKKALSILLILALICVPLAACAGDTTPPPSGGDTPATGDTPETGDTPATDDTPPAGGDIRDVTLTLWGGEFDQDMLRDMADAFIAHYANEANITVNIGVESESSAKDTILTDPQAAADVFATVDDQLMELYNAGALQEVAENVDAIRAANLELSVNAATINGKLMAYPMTSDNGHILFFNKEFISAEEVGSWDSMLEVAAGLGKQVSMDLGNGWWNVGFFRGAGIDFWLGDDGVSTETNLGTESNAVNVIEAMIELATNPAFISLGGDESFAGMQDGSIIAVIDGPWRTDALTEALGENFGAAKLPTFNMGGSQVQMGGVLGSKLVGVNRFSEEAGWAMRLADWITNEPNQALRFEVRKQGPSNIVVANSAEVAADITLGAIAIQARFSASFIPGGNYWGPSGALAEIIAQGNPSNTPIQELIDNAVEGMTQ